MAPVVAVPDGTVAQDEAQNGRVWGMPNSERPKLGDSTTMMLIAAGRLAQRRFETALADHNLTLRHVGAIGHLAHTPGLSYSDLARRARVTPQSMHATIGQLVELGAVVTETQGRASFLRLTTHGHELLALAADAAYACDDSLGFDSNVMAEFRAELKKTAMQALRADPSSLA
jgi:DNA-binding MarR family transcriptional regulator